MFIHIRKKPSLFVLFSNMFVISKDYRVSQDNEGDPHMHCLSSLSLCHSQLQEQWIPAAASKEILTTHRPSIHRGKQLRRQQPGNVKLSPPPEQAVNLMLSLMGEWAQRKQEAQEKIIMNLLLLSF